LKKLQVNDVLANIGTLRSTLSSVAVNESWIAGLTLTSAASFHSYH
jgi:hypothetical protein